MRNWLPPLWLISSCVYTTSFFQLIPPNPSRRLHSEKYLIFSNTLYPLLLLYIHSLCWRDVPKKKGNRKLDMTTQSNRHSLSFLTLSLFGVFFLDKCKNVKFSTKILFSSSSKISYFQTVCPFFLFCPHSLSFGEMFRYLRKQKLKYKNLDMKTQYQDASNFNQMRPSFIFNQSLLKWFKKDSYNPRCITLSVSLHCELKYLFKILEYPELWWYRCGQLCDLILHKDNSHE